MLTEREKKIVAVIGRKRLSFDEIAQEVFKGVEELEVPFDPAITINNSVNRIIKKCSRYKLEWTLNKVRNEGRKFYVYKTARK